MPVGAWLGFPPQATDAQRTEVAQRIVLACLLYHWARAKSRASGEHARVPPSAPWVLALRRMAREVMATVPCCLVRAAVVMPGSADRKGGSTTFVDTHTHTHTP